MSTRAWHRYRAHQHHLRYHCPNHRGRVDLRWGRIPRAHRKWIALGIAVFVLLVIIF